MGVNNEKRIIPVEQEKFFIEALEKEQDALMGDVCSFEDERKNTIKSVMENRLNDAIDIIKTYSPHIANFFANLNGESVICVTQKTLEKAKANGWDFVLNSAKDGLSPVLRKCGKIVGHADLEERVLPNANLVPAIATAALAKQIAVLQHQLEDLQASLNIVIQGQWNDRFAKIDAAKNELFIALHTRDNFLKKTLLTKAIDLSCQGEAEVIRSMRDEIETIGKMGVLGWRVKQKTIEKVENLMTHIPYLFESWNVKMTLLQECGEYDAIREESHRIYLEMNNLFCPSNVEMLRSRTHNKIGKGKLGKKYWTKELPDKLNQNRNLLAKINDQTKFLVNIQG